MQYMIPDYYKEFACTAGQCEDTCCAGWQIVVDDRSWNRYCHVKGSFGRFLRRSLQRKDRTFRQTRDGRCACLNRENLCRMYQVLGKKSLCRTCRRYPRHVEEFENVREITLSLSCPEVAKLLLGKKESVQFLTYEKEGEETYNDYDPFFYFILADGREVMRRILQDREKTIEMRIGLVLEMALEMQQHFDNKDLFGCESIFEKYENRETEEEIICSLKKKLEKRTTDYQGARKLYAIISHFERLKEDWSILLGETQDVLYLRGEKGYRQVCSQFEEWKCGHLPQWDIWMEQLMVYFIYTYFCGAVYDGQILSKVKMAAASVRIIQEILIARWVMNAEQLDREDVKEVVYRYSRELEHSDINLRRLEEGVSPFALLLTCHRIYV